jgi:hypothetical protein
MAFLLPSSSSKTGPFTPTSLGNVFCRAQDWAAHNVQLRVSPTVEQSYHMFHLLLPSLEIRQNLIAYLRERGVYSVFHYLPLHLSDMGRSFGGKAGDCPVTERVSDQLIRLPSIIRSPAASRTGLDLLQVFVLVDTLARYISRIAYAWLHPFRRG